MIMIILIVAFIILLLVWGIATYNRLITERLKVETQWSQIDVVLKQRFDLIPNLVETEISMINSFAFKLPATALQIDSGMMVDVLVEYGENSADRNELIANVWARLVGGRTLYFLMPVRLPVREDEPRRDQVNRIFAALNENGTFKVKLYDFVAALLQGASGGADRM